MQDNKDFFENMNPNLGGLYNLKKEDVDEKDLYPIQSELKSLSDRFASSRPVGQGAMKKILSVKDLPSGRRVAKAGLIDPSDKKNIEAFLREARLTASLQHPNIIRIYDIGMDGEEPWFSMELIEGQSLKEKIEFHRTSIQEWPLFQRLELFNKICNAVAYAHSKNVLHLDIKPENIQLGLYGEVILCDWGLGYYVHDDEKDVNYLEMPHLKNENTLHGYIRGTPGYLAPERINGGKSISSDVFSLGALLYTLMTYEVPFEGEKLEEVLENTLKSDISEPKTKVPASIKSIYSKALKVKENDRYLDVQSMQEDVDKFRNGFATEAEEAGFLKQSVLFFTRNKAMCSMAAFFASLFVIVIYSYIQDIKQSEKQYRAEKEKAEDALAKYKQGEEEKKSINQDFTELLVASTKLTTDHFNMDRALKTINLAVHKDSQNLEAWLRKGYIHFIRHEFDFAYEAFVESKNSFSETQVLKQLCQTHIGNKGLLDPEKTIELLNSLPLKSQSGMRMYFLMHDSNAREKLNDHSLIVKDMLEYRNSAKTINFQFNIEDKSLDLSNNFHISKLDNIPMNSLRNFCILKTLKLKKLNLSNTGVVNLFHLSDLDDLEELNLEKTLVLDLNPLRNRKNLKKVILSHNQRRIAKGDWPFKIEFSGDSGNNTLIESQIKKILKRFDELDKDKSNDLSIEELSMFVPKESVIYFSKILNIDKNQDGNASREELNSVFSLKPTDEKKQEVILKILIEKFGRLDKDKDGEISKKELDSTWLSEYSDHPLLKKLDLNSNEKLSKKEIQKALK